MNLLDNKPEFDLAGEKNNVHIRLVNRGARKRITLVDGLDEFMGEEKISTMMKFLKKKLMCSITYTKNKVTKDKKAMHIQGDHGEYVKNFLIRQKLVDADAIETHGF